MHITVIIPALNEAGNLARLIGEIPWAAADSIKVIVVDNGSTDATAAVAQAAGAQVVSEPRRGYGYACAAGLRALDNRTEVIAFLDGDGSFDPAELPRLLAPLTADQADLVLGSRVKGGIEPGSMPPHQRFGNRLVSATMRVLYRIDVTDLGPFRAIRRSTLSSFPMREMTFGWPTEMIVKAARNKARIVEVPITYRRRWSGQSKVSGTVRGTLLATYFIVGVTLRYAFNKR